MACSWKNAPCRCSFFVQKMNYYLCCSAANWRKGSGYGLQLEQKVVAMACSWGVKVVAMACSWSKVVAMACSWRIKYHINHWFYSIF